MCTGGAPDSAFSLWMSIPRRHALLDRGAQFSKESESENFLKLSPKPAWTLQVCFFLLFCSFDKVNLLHSAPEREDRNITTAALTLCLSGFYGHFDSPEDSSVNAEPAYSDSTPLCRVGS